jgi:hypothetical protein
MVKTNEWSAPELCKYFSNVQSSLSQDELDRLRITPIFVREMPSGSNDKSPRYTASQLHEPLDVFRDMKVPILDWGTVKWRPTSDEGALISFLFICQTLR